MQRFAVLLLTVIGITTALITPRFPTTHVAVVGRHRSGSAILYASEEPSEIEQKAADEQPTSSSSSSSVDDNDGRYDVSKLTGSADDGAGFNQFDPVLKATGFMSRRFGIFGGLAIFGALFAVEGGEILKSFQDSTPTVGSGETITTGSGLKITELLVGKGGSTPLPGYVIGLRAVVLVGDKVIYDGSEKTGEKPIAFKLGQRPFQNVICEGVEEGIMSMKVGGKRILNVPADLAPPGVALPPGVPLTYEIELTEVLSGYF
jgi:hypothetical protein